jgi:hypothetical protein
MDRRKQSHRLLQPPPGAVPEDGAGTLCLLAGAFFGQRFAGNDKAEARRSVLRVILLLQALQNKPFRHPFAAGAHPVEFGAAFERHQSQEELPLRRS